VDAPLDPLATGPPDVPADDAVQPAAASNAYPDPLCRTLDRLEASIEQQRLPAYVDPLSTLLDQVEASVLRNSPSAPPTEDRRFLSALDRLERETEQQVVGGPRAGSKAAPEDTPASAQDGLVRRSGETARLRSEPPRPWDVGPRDSPFMRQHPEPGYHTMGGGAGIRGDGPELKGYCHLRKEWVRADDCASCSDFEREEEQSGDQEDRCRHMHADSEDEEKGDTEPSDQSDE
jgi:hypothetical protein